MKQGILRRISLEEVNSEGLETDATIGEATEAEADPDTTDDTPADETNALPEDSEQTDAAQEPEEALADQKIEYPEIGNLEVDKVAKQLAQDEAERDERTQDALRAADTLNEALEGLRAEVARTGTLSAWNAKQGAALLTKVRAEVGFDTPAPSWAMEDYGRFGPTDAAVALETFRDTFQAILRAVLAATQTALVWLKKAFLGFFPSVKRELALTVSLTNEILQLRGSDEGGALQAYRATVVLDDAHYVALPGHKRALTVMNKQPGEYTLPEVNAKHQPTGAQRETTWPSALHDILLVAQQHRAYQAQITPALAESFSSYLTTALAPEPGQDKVGVLSFDPKALLQPGYYESGAVSPMGPLKGCEFFVNDFFLGSFKVVTRLSVREAHNVDDSMEAIGDWYTAVTSDTSSVTDGWMAFLPTAVLKEASSVVMSIEQELLLYEKTVDKICSVEEKLKKMALQATEAIDRAERDFLETGATNRWRSEVLTTGLRAINCVVGNTNRALYDHATRAQQCCQAWNIYLAEILAKEKKLLAA